MSETITNATEAEAAERYRWYGLTPEAKAFVAGAEWASRVTVSDEDREAMALTYLPVAEHESSLIEVRRGDFRAGWDAALASRPQAAPSVSREQVHDLAFLVYGRNGEVTPAQVASMRVALMSAGIGVRDGE